MQATARKPGSVREPLPHDKDLDDYSDFLKSQFTAIPNAFLRALSSLAPAEIILALIIYRFTAGYCKEWMFAGELKMLEFTELGRSSFYEARRTLIARGIIQVRKSRSGTARYRMLNEYQPIRGYGNANDRAEDGEATLSPKSKILDVPYKYKERKENKHHQTQTAQAFATENDDEFLSTDFCNQRVDLGGFAGRAVYVVSAGAESRERQASMPNLRPSMEGPLMPTGETVPPAGPPISTPPDQADAPTAAVAPEKGRRAGASSFPLTDDQSALAAHLRAVGVSSPIAARLAHGKPAELIQAALKGLAARQEIRNPAGWLVQEIMAGGYQAPAAILAAEHRQKAASNRAAAQQTEQAERDAANARALAEWAEVQRLAPDDLADLVARARAQLAQLSPRLAEAPEDAPMVRGAVLDVYRKQRTSTPPVADLGYSVKNAFAEAPPGPGGMAAPPPAENDLELKLDRSSLKLCQLGV